MMRGFLNRASWLFIFLIARYTLCGQNIKSVVFKSDFEQGIPCWGLCVYSSDTTAYETLGGSPNISGHVPWNNVHTSRSFLVRDKRTARSGSFSICLNMFSSSTNFSTAAIEFECPLMADSIYELDLHVLCDEVLQVNGFQIVLFSGDHELSTLTANDLKLGEDGWYLLSGVFRPDGSVTHLGIRYSGIPRKSGNKRAPKIFLDDILISTPNVYECPVDSNNLPQSIIVLRDFNFEHGSAELLPESMPYIDSLVAYLNGFSYSQIVITGHTDDTGTVEFNEKLSLDRAQAIANKLIAYGVDALKIVVHGMGSSKPLVPNDTPENRLLNRRVEILIR